MTPTLRGFPAHFPVRDDGTRPVRYRAVSLTTRAVLRLWLGRGLLIDGLENLPPRGPLLVVCNHLSNLDPFFFGGFVPGTMFCIAKRELFTRSGVLAWILAGCNCFPVARGAPDRWALRTSLDVVRSGGRLLIFVEGTRARTPGMRTVEPGVGFLARRSGAPVVPVAVWGSEQVLPRDARLPRRARVHVRFGTPFEPAIGRRHDDGAVAELIAARVAALLPPAYRGVYADAALRLQPA